MARSLPLLAFLSALFTTVSGADVLFVDSGAGTYLRSPEFRDQADPFLPATVVAANAVLLGMNLPAGLDNKSAAQLDALLVPNAFKRPGSVAIFAICGLPLPSATLGKENVQLTGLSSLAHRSLATPLLQAAESSAEETLAAASLLHELAKLRNSAGEKLFLQTLGCDASPPCYGKCLDKELLSMAKLTGGSYKVGKTAGIGTFIVKGFEDSPLDLAETADRSLAFELACIIRSVATKEMPEAVSPTGSSPNLIYSTSTSIQVVRKAYGTDSRKVAAAASLLLDTVSHAVLQLQKAHNGRLAATVALLGDAPPETIFGLGSERAVRRLQVTEADDAKALVANVVVGATVIVLIVALILGSCALFGMSVTKDTLLYTSAKLD